MSRREVVVLGSNFGGLTAALAAAVAVPWQTLDTGRGAQDQLLPTEQRAHTTAKNIGSDPQTGPDPARRRRPAVMRRALPACLLAAAVLVTACTDDATDNGAGTTAPAATSSTAPAGLYTPAEAPTPPEVTTEIPANNVLPDGIYYGVARVGEAPGVVMEMTQLYTGKACLAWAERTGASCDNDYGVDDDPQAFRPVPDDAEVTVAQAEGPGTSYRINAAELLRLVRGEPPAAGAPAGYTYTPFPFLITVRGDQITRVEQWWVP